MMWNDMNFHLELMDTFDDELLAFRWLFIPSPQLNYRTPIEVLSDGGRARVMQVLQEYRYERSLDC